MMYVEKRSELYTLLAHSGIQCSFTIMSTRYMFSDAHAVDMQERCILCGGSQSTVKTSHWVSSSYVHLPLFHACVM